MGPDDALKLLGRYSKWQVKVYFVYATGFGILFAWMVNAIIFVGDTPNHRCALPPNTTLNETIPQEWRDGKLQYSRCEMYAVPGKNDTIRCTHGYWYDPASGYESTLVTEWDLVCGKNWQVELSMTANGIGKTLGLLVFPRLADLFGRRPIFMIAMWGNVVQGIVQAFSPNMVFFTVVSSIDGFLQQGVVSSAVVLSMELFPTEERTFAGVAIEFFWLFGMVTMVPIAYFVRNWRHLYLAITVPMVLSFSYYWLVPESIPWLIANGKKRKAEEILREAAKFNKVTLPEKIFEDDVDEGKSPEDSLLRHSAVLKEDSTIARQRQGTLLKWWDKFKNAGKTTGDDKLKYGILDLFKSAIVRKYTLCMMYIWFVNSLTYFTLNMTVTSLAGDRYLNFFLYGLMELPAYIVAYIALQKIGRIKPLVVFHFLCGVSLIANLIQTFDIGKNLVPLVITINMIGKFAISGSFAVIFCNTSEIFPTNIRNTGFGLCQVMGRAANYIGPYCRILSRAYPWATPVILGSLSMLAGIVALFLPETRHTRLPDTMEEVEAWNKQRRTQKKEHQPECGSSNTMEDTSMMENQQCRA